MAQSTQPLTSQDMSTAGFSGNGDLGTVKQSIVRNANDAVDLALAHTDADLATGERKGDAQAESLPASCSLERGNHDASQILDFPQPSTPPRPTVTFHALQEWEGHIVEIGEMDFLARLVDLTAGATHEEEEALIPMAEISDDDAAGMQLGSIFRWVIGYERSATGTKKRVSQFVFRDLPVITKRDLHDGESWAREIARSLDL